jgi:alpha-L-rhamnosidase
MPSYKVLPRIAAALSTGLSTLTTEEATTKAVGVGYLCPTLTAVDRPDVAYRLLLNEAFPSWGYMVRNGATTIWERWDGWTEERGFQTPQMSSFNHYSLGSVGA